MSKPQSVWRSWFLAARPKTLTAAFVPILVGTALSYRLTGKCRPELSLIALISTLLIQIGTNLINDSYDFVQGADTEDRLGPKRATQSGWIHASRVKAGGLFCFLLAALCALPLVVVGGWPILVMGILSLLFGFLYTAGPCPLAYVGLGDLFVLIFFGWVAVGGIYFLNTESYHEYALLAGTQVGLFATVLIAINNFRDLETDRLVNKMTCAVRFGETFCRLEIGSLIGLGFGLGAFWLKADLSYSFYVPLLSFPLGAFLVHQIVTTRPGRIYNQFLAYGAMLQLAFGVSLSMSLFFF